MRRWLSCIGVVVLSIGMVTGCGNAETVEAEDDVPVELQHPVTEAFGKVIAAESENIAIEVPGKVLELVANNGQTVKSGDVLFRVDISDYLFQLDQSKKNLAIKVLELENLESSSLLKLQADKDELTRLESKYETMEKKLNNGSHEELLQLWHVVSAAEVTMAEAEADLVRSQQLVDEGIISESEFRSIQHSASNARLAWDQAKVSYSLQKSVVKESLETLAYQIILFKSDVNSLETREGDSTLAYELKALEVAMLEQSYQAMVEKMSMPYMKENGDVICHSESGIFDGFELEVGDYISGLSEVKTYSLAQNSQLLIQAEISEDFISEVDLGASVEIVPVSDRNKTYHGSVTYISDMAYIAGGDSIIMVHINVEDNDGFLKPNYSVDVEIEGAQIDG